MDSTFDDIAKSIAAAASSVQVPSKDPTPMKPDGMPDVSKVSKTKPGRIVSMPGSENVTLDGSVFQLMTCSIPGRKTERTRYCIVEKGVQPKYGNQFYNSTGELTHVITRQLYILLSGILNNANKQIIDLTSQLERVEEQRDLHKTTIDALRKNGIID